MFRCGGAGVFSADTRDYFNGNVLLLANPFEGGISLPTDHHRLADDRSVERTLHFKEFHGLRLHSLARKTGLQSSQASSSFVSAERRPFILSCQRHPRPGALWFADNFDQVCIRKGSAFVLEAQSPDAFQNLRVPVRRYIQFQLPNLVLQGSLAGLNA